MQNDFRVCAYLDKRDVEAMMEDLSAKLAEELNGTFWKKAKAPYHVEVAPLVKKLAQYLDLWESLMEEERKARDAAEDNGGSGFWQQIEEAINAA